MRCWALGLLISLAAFGQAVVGPAPAGSTPIGNPVQVAGSDGTDLRTIKTDSSGNVGVTSSGGIFEVSPTTSANTASNPFFTEISDGTNTANVKAASTQSVAADKSLVIQINPNQPNLSTPLNVAGSGVFEVSPTTSANTASNPFFTEISDGTNTANVKAASTQSASTDKSLVVQINPNTPAAAALGQGATAASAPSGAVQQGVVAATSYPTAVTNGQMIGAMADKAGRIISVPYAPRDFSGSTGVQSTSSSASTLLAAGGTGVFNDITSISCSNESSTATVVTISDNGSGGNTYKFNVAGTAGAYGGIPLEGSPLKQGTSAAAWDILNSAAVTLDCNITYVQNK